MYLAMKARHCFMSGASSHCLSVGSLTYAAVVIPWLLSRPAGFRTDATEAETLLRYCAGFQPSSPALRIAWAANFGVETLKNTFAPESFNSMIWLSTVGSVTS